MVSLYDAIVREDIRIISILNDRIEKAIEEERHQAQKEIEMEMISRGLHLDDDRPDFEMEYEMEHFDSYTMLPQTMRYSVLALTYGVLDNALVQACKSFERVTGCRLKYSDLTGSGIEQTRKYLELVAGVNIPVGGLRWKRIQEIRKIRNAVVHDGAETNEKLRSMIAEMRRAGIGVSIIGSDDRWRVELNRTFNAWVIEQIVELTQDILLPWIDDAEDPDLLRFMAPL